MAATVASREGERDISSDDSDAEQWQRQGVQLGSLELVYRTLDGIGAQSKEDGDRGFGRHATTVRIGRKMWQTDTLSEEVAQSIHEETMDDRKCPPAFELKNTLHARRKHDAQRPKPFAGGSCPYAHASEVDYGIRIRAWFEALRAEEDPPTDEQLAVLNDVRRRVLIELRLTKRGHEVARSTPEAQMQEEPSRVFVHGPQAQGNT